MTVSLLIEFHDPKRVSIDHPFSVESVVRERWKPLAEPLGLPLLAAMGGVLITERAEVEQLVAELARARARLEADGPSLGADRDYMAERVDRVMPLLSATLADWPAVAEVSL